MPEFIRIFFLELYKNDPKWNFIFFYDSSQADRVMEGFWMTLELAVICVILSVVIGVVGAWMQNQPNRVLRILVQGYIQFFRNTPPLIQLMKKKKAKKTKN